MSVSCTVMVECAQDADLVDDFRLVQPDPAGPYTMTIGTTTVAASARDLTGCTLEAVIAPSASFSTIIDHLGTTDFAIDDPVNGHARFGLPAARVATWPIGTWFFVMRLVGPNGSLVEVMRGPWIVSPRKFP